MMLNRMLKKSLVLVAGSTLLVAFMPGCETLTDAPRGSKSLLEITQPSTSPSEAAEMATDPYNAENRFRGTTLLSNADFGGQQVYIDLYLDGVDDADPGVRTAAIRALGRHGDPEHAHLMVAGLEDENRLVRIEAARALQRVHSSDAVPALIDAINVDNEADADVRAVAADALGQYQENRVVQALIAAMRDPRLVVNNRVQKSLRTLTGQNFGLDRRMWLDWYNDTDDLFVAGQLYTYPVFHRKRRPIEYFPMISQPPNETTSTPVGLDPIVGG